MSIHAVRSGATDLHDLGEKTRLIINAALDAIIGIDMRGRIMIWNPQAEATFGWTCKEILGRPLADAIVPERFREKHNRGFQTYLETGIHTTLNRKLEIFAIDRHQREFPIELSILPIRDGDHEFFCAFIRDISDRRKAEQAILEEKEFSETLINSLPGIFYLFNQQGKYLHWNRNLETVSGYTGAEIGALHPTQFFLPEEQDAVVERILEVFTTRGASQVEARFVDKWGHATPYYFTGKFIEVQGEPCLMGMGIDISTRVRLQDELMEKSRRMQQEMTTAVIRAQENERSQLGLELHDNVNQVLTTVKLYNEMLRDNMGDPETLIQRSVEHLQACINEIRSISKRLSAPTLGKISFADSIGELVQSINLTDRLTIECRIDERMPHVMNQETHLALYRIVQEGINNIIKHADATHAVITTAYHNHWLYLSIEDNGKGFDTATKTCGIGLTNMKSRAGNLGGELLTRSQPGCGFLVEVRVPIGS